MTSVRTKQKQKSVEELKTYSGEDRVISSVEMHMKLQAQPEALVNVKTGIPSLDQAMEGCRDGELIAVSGPTKNGKTLLVQTIAVNMVKQQEFPLFFTFEVPARQFLDQIRENEALPPMMYMPAKLQAHAISWVEERMQEAFVKYHTRVAFIDHLHYLVDIARMRQPSLEIGTVIRALKSIAVNNNFVIFLLCHTKMGKHEGSLSYESIRDSSFISQESDSVIMTKRTPECGTNVARARVEFHRRTGVMERVVCLEKQGSFLVELECEHKGNNELCPLAGGVGPHAKDQEEF